MRQFEPFKIIVSPRRFAVLCSVLLNLCLNFPLSCKAQFAPSIDQGDNLNTSILDEAGQLPVYASSAAHAGLQVDSGNVQKLSPTVDSYRELTPRITDDQDQLSKPLVGHDAKPPLVVGGDRGSPLPPPTGKADLTAGHHFPMGFRNERAVVFLHRDGPRGSRMVQTIRGDQLGADEIVRIERILGINFASGPKAIHLIIDDQKLGQVHQVLFPYPGAQINGNRKKIVDDQPVKVEARARSGYWFEGHLPTVKSFCRYLVILGVVSATIWMALAAYSIIVGHPYGGRRVVGAAAGLMLLLTGYTIWKVIQVNIRHIPNDAQTINRKRSTTTNTTHTHMDNAIGSAVKGHFGGPGERPNRSGLPVSPLIGNQPSS